MLTLTEMKRHRMHILFHIPIQKIQKNINQYLNLKNKSFFYAEKKFICVFFVSLLPVTL